MATATANEAATVSLQRVYVRSAITGELIYDPTHPWLSQVRVFRLKRWTCINGSEDLPSGCTMFHFEFLCNQQRVDDFRCLGDLTSERTLELTCVVKNLPRPGARACRSLAEAIRDHQPRRIWHLLSRYQMPQLLQIRQGETINPLHCFCNRHT